MPSDPTSQTALIVLAVAVSIQTLLLGALVVAAALAWRRLERQVDRGYRELLARMDDTARPFREAADALQVMSNRASAAMDRAEQLAGSARAWLTIPRSLMTAGMATVASLALGSWRRHRKATGAAPQVDPGSRAIH